MPRGQNAEGEEMSAAQQGQGGKRVTPMDIQEKVFRSSFRGYQVREVDEFLDLVTEEMARLFTENKRLREELARRASAPTPAPEAAPAASPDAAHLSSLASGFIAREREFLQTLAGLIQSHAQAVKSDVRSVREAPAPEPTVATPPAVEAAAAAPAPATPTPEAAVPATAVASAAPEPATPAAMPVPTPDEDIRTEASAPAPVAPSPAPVAPPAPPAPQPFAAPVARPATGRLGDPEPEPVAPSPVRVEEDPRLVDLTEEDADTGEPTQLMQPVASEVAAESPSFDQERDERPASPERPKDHEASLRELFWGED